MSKTTQYQQGADLLESLVPLCEELLQANEPCDKVDVYQQLEAGVNQLMPMIRKFKEKSAEKDPDKQIYGAAMLANIKVLIDKFEKLQEVFEEELQPIFDHLLKKQLKKQKEEEERMNLMSEAERLSFIEKGREHTKKEEENRRMQLLEQEQQKKKQDEAEQHLALLAKIVEEETAKRRVALLAEIVLAEKELKNVGFERYCLKGLKRMAAGCPRNKEFRDALDPVIEFVASICRDPQLHYLRVVRWLNEQFENSVARCPGSTSILLAVGFKLQTQIEAGDMLRKARQSLTEHQPSAPVPGASTYPNDELYWILEEPHAMNDHDQWREWLERIELIHRSLSRIRDELRRDLQLEPAMAIEQYEQQLL